MWPISFRSPTREDLTYVGRYHGLVEGLARWRMVVRAENRLDLLPPT